MRHLKLALHFNLLQFARLNALLFAIVAVMIASTDLHAQILWDGEAGTQWWFDPVNWDRDSNANNQLPPGNATSGVTETQINSGFGLDAEGVVFDPLNDPFSSSTGEVTFPSGFGPQIVNQLSMSVNTTVTNLLTIKGDLIFKDRVQVGRSSGVRGAGTNATIVQESGYVRINSRELDIAQVDTLNPGYGNGVYDYRGGSLDISQTGGSGLRLSNGSNTATSDGMKSGPAGTGKFIVRNPETPGHIRAYSVTTSAFAGFDEGAFGPTGSVLDPAFDPNGITTGVGIFEFHYANGGTRAIQVNTNMFLHNGVDQNTLGVRSSRLDLILDQAACDGAECVPNSIGLFDIDYDGFGYTLLGSGDLDGDGNFNNDRVFSNITDTVDYREGGMVSAVFGSTQYNWTISYTGNIVWANANNSVIGSITGNGTGADIVLIGHSSSPATGLAGDFDGDGDVDGRDFLVWQRGDSPSPLSATDLGDWQTNYGLDSLVAISAVPEPTSLMLLFATALPLFGGRRS